MTLRMKSGLAALSFSVLCWAALINASVAYLTGEVDELDPMVTASITSEQHTQTR